MSEVKTHSAVAEALRGSRNTLGASRARFYLMTDTGDYRLAASYGFVSRFGPEEVLTSGHPLVEWVQHHRRPAFVNSPAEAGQLGEAMERDHYAHSLTAPVYQGSRMVGILELQDRLGGAPFGWEDIRRVETAVQRLEAILGRFDAPVAQPDPMPQEDQEALFLADRPAKATLFPAPPDLFSAEAKEAAGQAERPEPPAPPAPRRAPPDPVAEFGPATDAARQESRVLKGFFNTLLLNSELDAVVFSSWTRDLAEITIAARRDLAPPAMAGLVGNLESALRSSAPDLPLANQKTFRFEFPFGHSAGEIPQLGGVQTSVINSGPTTLLLSLVFQRPPSAQAEAAWRQTHRLVRASILRDRWAERYRRSFRSLVHFLIEPELRSFPQLKAHALGVAALCRRLAGALGMPSETVEQLAVAGLVHDIGLKCLELPYERIAGRRALDLQELGVVRQHPAIGATLLSAIDFPYPVAPLVKHHHERFDGSGYPDRLSGESIPLGSRIIAIAEAYDAMVAPHSYRAPVSSEAALEIILLKAGTQFDPELARRFRDLVRETAAEDGVAFPQIEP
jgi:hypothetical protein